MLAILFMLLNAALSFIANYMIQFSILEITPAAIAILVWNGGNYLLNGVLLVCAYNVVSVKNFRYAWFKIPLAILVGFLATGITSMFLLLFIYYLIMTGVAMLTGFLNPRYAMFVVVNFCVNVVLYRLYHIVA